MAAKQIKIIGLRTATAEEIAKLKIDLEKQLWQVVHVTHNLPYNGVLKCYKHGVPNYVSS